VGIVIIPALEVLFSPDRMAVTLVLPDNNRLGMK